MFKPTKQSILLSFSKERGCSIIQLIMEVSSFLLGVCFVILKQFFISFLSPQFHHWQYFFLASNLLLREIYNSFPEQSRYLALLSKSLFTYWLLLIWESLGSLRGNVIIFFHLYLNFIFISGFIHLYPGLFCQEENVDFKFPFVAGMHFKNPLNNKCQFLWNCISQLLFDLQKR